MGKPPLVMQNFKYLLLGGLRKYLQDNSNQIFEKVEKTYTNLEDKIKRETPQGYASKAKKKICRITQNLLGTAYIHYLDFLYREEFKELSKFDMNKELINSLDDNIYQERIMKSYFQGLNSAQEEDQFLLIINLYGDLKLKEYLKKTKGKFDLN
ncbi:MAG: hypothetical protein KKA62_01440 [Nanoarchaeota archaeon]|nr:hypothetical protein [Nanoarchaeota archaeon]